MTEAAKTQKVAILVLNDSSMMTVASVIDPLRAANRISRRPLFSWEILSLSGAPIKLTCGIEIQADRAMDHTGSGDLLIVIAGFDHEQQTSTKHSVALHNLAAHYTTVFGVEAGTWSLAKAGVINDHMVTTHWEDLENLADTYPNLRVSAERYVIDQKIWTCGGASPAFDMMLQYLRATNRKSLALDVASVFIYVEASAATDAQASHSLGRLQSAEPRLAKAIKIMEQNIEDPIAISELALRVGVSDKTLQALWRRHLSTTPGNYYLRLRLQTARRLVLDTNLRMLDVAIRSGFASQAAFSRAFRRHYDQTPLDIKRLGN